MVPGNLFSAAALAASVYLPEGRPHSRCEQSEKKWIPGQAPGAVSRKFRVPKKTSWRSRKKVGKRQKVGRKTAENGSENGRKWVGKWQKMGQKGVENGSANKKKVFQ